jgi:adenylate cyclase
MQGELKQGAVLFADLSGSTSLYETLGNVAAADTVRAALERLSQGVRDGGGDVIKTLGDGVLAWFPGVDAAAEAAMAIQRRRDGRELPVRVGFHYGEAVHEPSDIFGDAVNVAARLASSAGADEILTSRESVSRLSEPLAARTRAVGVERFRGKAQATQVFQLLWDEDRNITRAVGEREVFDQVLNEMRALRLTFRGRERVVTPRYMPFTFGRDPKASLSVNSDLVSRSHARLEFNHGKFVLSDHSTNGTYVAPEGGAEVLLRRESMPLAGRGTLGLGGRPLQNPDVAIRYVFE